MAEKFVVQRVTDGWFLKPRGRGYTPDVQGARIFHSEDAADLLNRAGVAVPLVENVTVGGVH